MHLTVNLDSLGVRVPSTNFGVNIFSGSYIQLTHEDETPMKTYGIVSAMSLGSDSSTILYGTLKTAPIRLDPGEFQSLSVSNIANKYIDIQVDGTVVGSGRADLTISLIDESGRTQTVLQRKHIQVSGGQLSSTRIRGRGRLL